MKMLSFLTLSTLLTISSCSHMSKSCCKDKEHCSKEAKKACCEKSSDKECKDEKCDKKEAKACCSADHCKKA